MEKTSSQPGETKKISTRKPKITPIEQEEIYDLKRLIHAIESAGIHEFSDYIRSPLRMLWPNFVAGVARGFGALVGVALVLGTIGWIFSMTIDLPLIGKSLEPYVVRAQDEINRYIEQTNYSDEFRNLDMTLKAIEKNTTPKN